VAGHPAAGCPCRCHGGAGRPGAPASEVPPAPAPASVATPTARPAPAQAPLIGAEPGDVPQGGRDVQRVSAQRVDEPSQR